MSLEVRQLTKHYGKEKVLKEVGFSLIKGDCLAVLGASGSGKSTLLKILAGLEPAPNYTLHFEQEPLHHLSTQERGIVYMHQEALLFPFLNVLENVVFGLKARQVPRDQREASGRALLQELALADMAYKRPEQLSGGQKQRVAFARALIIEPRLLLLDEPFGALDAPTRQKMQKLFLDLSASKGITSLFVTHDAREALVVGDRYAYLEAGHLIQYPDHQSFIKDERSGLMNEMRFWRQWGEK